MSATIDVDNLQHAAIMAYRRYADECERRRQEQIDEQTRRERERRASRLRQLVGQAFGVSLDGHPFREDLPAVRLDGLWIGTIYDQNAHRLILMDPCWECGRLTPREGSEFNTLEGLGLALINIEAGRIPKPHCGNCEERSTTAIDPRTIEPLSNLIGGAR